MKKLLFLAAAFVTVCANAQQKVDEVIKMNAERHDFGKVKQSVPAVTYFTLTNISDKPVVIENAWASCGCTTPEVSKAPIPPHGSTKVKVGYNAASMGHFDKDVSIKLAGIQDVKVIKITGEVVDANSYEAYTKSDEFKKAEKARLAKEAKEAKESKKAAKKAKKSVTTDTK
jgi:hypothetical protein